MGVSELRLPMSPDRVRPGGFLRRWRNQRGELVKMVELSLAWPSLLRGSGCVDSTPWPASASICIDFSSRMSKSASSVANSCPTVTLSPSLTNTSLMIPCCKNEDGGSPRGWYSRRKPAPERAPLPDRSAQSVLGRVPMAAKLGATKPSAGRRLQIPAKSTFDTSSGFIP